MIVEFLKTSFFEACVFASVVLTPFLFFLCADRRKANKYSSRSELSSTQEISERTPKHRTASQRSALGSVKSRRGDSKIDSVQSSETSNGEETGFRPFKSPLCDLSRTDRSQTFGESSSKLQVNTSKPRPSPTVEADKREKGTKQSKSNLGLPKRGLRRKSTISLVTSPLPAEAVKLSETESNDDGSNRETSILRQVADRKMQMAESESDEVPASIYLAEPTSSVPADPGKDTDSEDISKA